MSSPLAVAIAKSGLLDDEILLEFSRWGVPLDDLHSGPKPQSVQEVVALLEEALQSEGLVVEKLTDLEIVRQYLATQMVGLLHVEVGEESAEFTVPYGRTQLGEYVFPWKGDAVAEEMTNGLTYFVPADEKPVYFFNMWELYFGDQKVFMVCAPHTETVGHAKRQ